MKKFITALLGLSLLGAPVLASTEDPYVKHNSLEALGCMKLKECTKDVERITDVSQLDHRYGPDWYGDTKAEIRSLIALLNASGVEVYIGPDYYFPVANRGVYYTDVNRLFLNDSHVWHSEIFINVLRHEGWHAAQDCMAGTIDNSYIAIIFNDYLIPDHAKIMADVRYRFFAPESIPWEQEAIWAGGEAHMTTDALNACAAGQMWTEYEPTPKTREWLVKNNYIKQ